MILIRPGNRVKTDRKDTKKLLAMFRAGLSFQAELMFD